MSRSCALAFAISAVISGCSDDAPDTQAQAGSAGQAGSATSAGQTSVGGGGQPTAMGGSSSGSTSTAGTGTAGSALGGSGGAGGSSGGSGGSGGGSAGTSTGTGGVGSTNFWGAAGPKKQWTCPAGPFPAQQQGAQTNICNTNGFKYNYGYNEGPTWIASENAFFFSNFIQGSNEGGDIIKYTLGGACEVWLHEVGCNGLGVSPSGNLLAACHGPRAVMEYDVKTKQGRTIASMVNGKLLDSPNDLIAHSNGNIYFSNTTYELGPRTPGLGTGLVRIDPLGNTSLIEAGGLNGVALSPDETKLYVVGKGVWTLDAMGVPGQKGGGGPGGDGIAVDCAGNVSNNGTNSAFGGPDGKTLLVVGGGTAAKTIAMTVPGLP
ncbi:MAG TPA: SMP-30/gluconolactonase/LRE family protein [Polyangiaceae bacterium]|nr:SMP-30/gluconolactonase/LRE family protein [Polyangiaceae bacterium]